MNWMLNVVALPGCIGRGIQGASSETGLLAGFFVYRSSATHFYQGEIKS